MTPIELHLAERAIAKLKELGLSSPGDENELRLAQASDPEDMYEFDFNDGIGSTGFGYRQEAHCHRAYFGARERARNNGFSFDKWEATVGMWEVHDRRGVTLVHRPPEASVGPAAEPMADIDSEWTEERI